jgi:hypothetical protein
MYVASQQNNNAGILGVDGQGNLIMAAATGAGPN